MDIVVASYAEIALTLRRVTVNAGFLFPDSF
jgi:hypothetical protein